MKYLVTAAEMRRYDFHTSDHFKVPSVVLMERAALACCQVIINRQRQLLQATQGLGVPLRKRVLVVAGTGNNGGDGLAVGRLLLQEGFLVDFWLVGEKENTTKLTALQLSSVCAYGGKIGRTMPAGEYDIIIDALFGVGLSRPLTGSFRDAVTYMNAQDAYVLSVDIPSGIHADTGAVMGCAVQADVTVTFGFQKLGTFLYPGASYTGTLLVAPIGITEDSFLGEPPGIFTFTENITELLPQRQANGNKATFGKVMLLAGSPGMAGACILAGEGAFAAGCGMVQVVTDASNREILQQALPEAIFAASCNAAGKKVPPAENEASDPDWRRTLADVCGWADVLAAGPGISTGKLATMQLRFLLEQTKKPLILDADAINLLALDDALLQFLIGAQSDAASWRPLALTPHPAELARLAGLATRDVLADPVGVTAHWAQKLSAVVLCKGARTFVASPDGRIYANGSGNSGMATAGSGDVLTGILAALAAQDAGCQKAADIGKQERMEALFAAVCTGVYLHGLAGDRAAHEKSEYSMKAGDIAGAIPSLFL